MLESIIDYPNEKGLSQDIWEKDGDEYVLKTEVREKIESIFEKCPYQEVVKAMKDIRIVGSICSNTYDENTDIDVHVSVDMEKLPKEKSFQDWQKMLMKWSHNNQDKLVKFDNHPIEIFLQDNYYQDLVSDGVYMLDDDVWITGPNFREEDPYDLIDALKSDFDQDADEFAIAFEDLRHSIIDYEIIKKSLDKVSKEMKKKMLERLKEKLEEITISVDELKEMKKKWREDRKVASSPKNEKEAKKLKESGEFDRKNATFKMLNRYQYLPLISALEKAVEEDGEVVDSNVKDVKKVIVDNIMPK